MATGQELDVEQVMERIRENIRRRRSAGEAAEPAPMISASTDAPAADEPPTIRPADLHALHDIRVISFESHRPVLGPVVGFLKRALRKLLTPILNRQVAYNETNVRVFEAFERRLDRVEGRFAQAIHDTAALLPPLRQEMLGAQRAFREEVLAGQARLHDELARQAQTLAADAEALAVQWQALEKARQTGQAATERIAAAERKLRRILFLLQSGPAGDRRADTAIGAAAPSPPARPEAEPEFDYAGFEARFRGSEEDIKERQRIYVPYFEGRENVLDVGCGRGEFLELLRENGIKARGVDLDLDMVLACRDKGLDVVMADAFAQLAGLPDDSLGGVFAAQVIEHLTPPRIIELVKLCRRKLAPGAALILETPNPKCLMVFADSFYRDPSHVQPIHPDTMRFLLEATGFEDVDLKFLAPVDPALKIPPLELPHAPVDRFNEAIERLNTLLFGAQDYAVIGRKRWSSTYEDVIARGPDA